MKQSGYDLGIHSGDISDFLRSHGVVKIIGYVRSGKSTLAEILLDELEANGDRVFLQNATKWLHSNSPSQPSPSREYPSVDPEITETLTRLENDNYSYWIVDDAEVLIAYASEEILESIARKLREGVFMLILIRNRFVLEQAGWFRDREMLINPDIPRIQMLPLYADRAIDAALSLFHDSLSKSKASWLVEMSGGIPGLMHELAPFATDSPMSDIRPELARRALIKRSQLRLEDTFRRSVIKALDQRILPPYSMLSEHAQVELGGLKLSGMVYDDYELRDNPFCGTFWRLVIGGTYSPKPIPHQIAEAALNLAILFEDNGLADYYLEYLSIQDSGNMELAKAFALSLTCQQAMPNLIRPLHIIFAESLGVLQINMMLKKQGIDSPSSMNVRELADLLIQSAGLQ